MQNLTTTTTPPQPTEAQELQHAGSLIERAARACGDESTDYLSWEARDRIGRQLHAALTIIRERATPPAPVASCLSCGSVELAASIVADDCPTCAFTFAVSH